MNMILEGALDSRKFFVWEANKLQNGLYKKVFVIATEESWK